MLNEVRRKPEKPRIRRDGLVWRSEIPTSNVGMTAVWFSLSLPDLYDLTVEIISGQCGKVGSGVIE